MPVAIVLGMEHFSTQTGALATPCVSRTRWASAATFFGILLSASVALAKPGAGAPASPLPPTCRTSVRPQLTSVPVNFPGFIIDVYTPDSGDALTPAQVHLSAVEAPQTELEVQLSPVRMLNADRLQYFLSWAAPLVENKRYVLKVDANVCNEPSSPPPTQLTFTVNARASAPDSLGTLTAGPLQRSLIYGGGSAQNPGGKSSNVYIYFIDVTLSRPTGVNFSTYWSVLGYDFVSDDRRQPISGNGEWESFAHITQSVGVRCPDSYPPREGALSISPTSKFHIEGFFADSALKLSSSELDLALDCEAAQTVAAPTTNLANDVVVNKSNGCSVGSHQQNSASGWTCAWLFAALIGLRRALGAPFAISSAAQKRRALRPRK